MRRAGTRHSSGLAAALAVGFALGGADETRAQTAWRPERAVEFIISTAAGGSNDQVARLMQRVLQEQKLLAVPTVVLNRPGGNQTLGVAYLNQHPGDSHFQWMANPTVITNPLTGITQVTLADLTPIAGLLVEHTAISVKADSPIRNLRDLTERLRADPESMSVGTVARGGVNHLALTLALKTGGVDVKRVKVVIFKTNAESMTAMVGGHIQLVASSVSSAGVQVKAGNARAIAVAANRRVGGAFAETATFREQGIDTWVANWRGMIAPRGTPAAQVAFWEEAYARMAATEEWSKQLAVYDWAPQFQRTREFIQYLDTQHNAARAMMAELGLVK